MFFPNQHKELTTMAKPNKKPAPQSEGQNEAPQAEGMPQAEASEGNSNMNDTTAIASGTVPANIDGIKMDLPKKTKAGDIMTAKDSNIVDGHNRSQFTNNMNAGAVYRARKLPEAKTDEEREKYRKWTKEDYLAEWNKYTGAEVGRVRTSKLDKLRSEAAWNVWVVVCTEHNAMFPNGFHPLLGEGAKGKKADPDKKEKDTIVKKLLSLDKFKPAIETEFQALQAKAEKESAKTAADEPVVSGASFI